MLITISARTGDSNKASLTKKVSGAIAWLEVGEIAWLPLDMAYESVSAANFDNLLCSERPRAQVWQSMRSNSLIKYGSNPSPTPGTLARRRQTNLGRVVSTAPAGFNERECSTDSQIRSSSSSLASHWLSLHPLLFRSRHVKLCGR